ncbi:hypothetical protein ACPA9J_16100 [Pseudomonas aeruginosa]
MRYRKTVIVLTLAAFVGARCCFRLVPQQFFPPSARLELLLDIKPGGGRLTALYRRGSPAPGKNAAGP